MVITKIKIMRGRRPRYGVHIDGQLALELSDWTIGKFGLRTGDEIDQPTIEKLKSADAETQAKNIAINYLSYRKRSSKEVIDHLIKKGFIRECAENIAISLQSMRMINDLDFAYSFVRDRLKRKPTGRALLRMQLLSKGISPVMADQVLAELISPQNQQTAAIQAARKKMQMTHYSKKSLDAEKRKKRLLDFLLRRGFSYEIALKTIRTTLEH